MILLLNENDIEWFNNLENLEIDLSFIIKIKYKILINLNEIIRYKFKKFIITKI